MKAGLYQDCHGEFFSLTEVPIGGIDGIEHIGDYEISGATLHETGYGGRLVEYKGELYTLRTAKGKPFILVDGRKVFLKAEKLKYEYGGTEHEPDMA